MRNIVTGEEKPFSKLCAELPVADLARLVTDNEAFYKGYVEYELLYQMPQMTGDPVPEIAK